MITTLSTQDPDNPGNPGKKITVTVDWAHVPVSAVTLTRGDVEGNSRALKANITFGAAAGVPAGATDFDVEVDVETAGRTAEIEGHTVRMRDGLPIASPEDLQGTWDMGSTSGGDGNILAVTVRTIVR